MSGFDSWVDVQMSRQEEQAITEDLTDRGRELLDRLRGFRQRAEAVVELRASKGRGPGTAANQVLKALTAEGERLSSLLAESDGAEQKYFSELRSIRATTEQT